MNSDLFAGLPDESRLWIHGFRTPLDPAQEELVRKVLSAFVEQWETHGRRVDAKFAIVESRFVITAAFCYGGVSGCSTDGFVRVFKSLKDEFMLDGLDGGFVYWRGADGSVQCAAHLDFFGAVEREEISPDTVVFDTLINRLSELRSGQFEKKFRESWHARTYQPALSPKP